MGKIVNHQLAMTIAYETLLKVMLLVVRIKLLEVANRDSTENLQYSSDEGLTVTVNVTARYVQHIASSTLAHTFNIQAKRPIAMLLHTPGLTTLPSLQSRQGGQDLIQNTKGKVSLAFLWSTCH